MSHERAKDAMTTDQSAAWDQIEREIRRVVDPAGVNVGLAANCQRGEIARVETCEAVWGMPASDFLELFHGMPDRAHILALRQAVGSDARKLSFDGGVPRRKSAQPLAECPRTAPVIGGSSRHAAACSIPPR